MSGDIQSTTLENGVRVITERMPGIRSISVGALVGVGSRHETLHESGYAHLIEHMLFQGTGERDAQAIAEMMEISGGAIGAFTTREYTVYHATVLDDYLPFALEALGDMLGNSVLPQDALDRQRSVILSEMAGHEDPLSAANDLLKSALWSDHPLARKTIGNPTVLNEATREPLLAFMERHYIGENTILAAAGNVDHDALVQQARDALWQMERGEHNQQNLSSPTSSTGILVGDQKDYQQVYFTLAWSAPEYVSPERYTWHVFSTLYGGSPTSKLYSTIREKMGLTYHISAQYQAYADAGAIVVEGATMADSLVPALASIIIELLKMGDEEIELDHHYRATESLVSQHLVSGDSAYVRMSRLALQDFYFKRPVSSSEVTRALKVQNPEAVQEIARTIAQQGLPVISLVGPITDEILLAVGDMLSDFGDYPEIKIVDPQAANSTIRHPLMAFNSTLSQIERSK